VPNFPVGVTSRVTRNYGLSFVAAGGDVAGSSVDLQGDGADVEFELWANVVANLSNAALIGTTITVKNEIPIRFASPFDESYSSASTKLVMVYGNDAFEVVSFSIPAPDETLFGSDGVTVQAANPQILNLNIATISFLNQIAGGNFGFLRGFRSERTRKLPRGRSVRNSIEPPVGEAPGRAPGEEIG